MLQRSCKPLLGLACGLPTSPNLRLRAEGGLIKLAHSAIFKTCLSRKCEVCATGSSTILRSRQVLVGLVGAMLLGEAWVLILIVHLLLRLRWLNLYSVFAFNLPAISASWIRRTFYRWSVPISKREPVTRLRTSLWISRKVTGQRPMTTERKQSESESDPILNSDCAAGIW